MDAAAPPIPVRRLAIPIYGATLLLAISRGTLFLLVPIDGLELGGLFGGFAVPGMLALGSVLIDLPGAMTISRVGHKPVMLGGLMGATLAAVVLAHGQSITAMALAALAYGLSAGVFGLARLAYLSDTVPLAQRGRVVSAVGGVHRIGMFAGPALGGLAASSLGRSTTLLLVSACVATVVPLIAFGLPHSPTVPSTTRRSPLGLVRHVLSENRRVFATAGLSMWSLALVRNARLLLIPICGTVLGLDTAETGFVKSLSAGADMLLFYPVGIAMDRLGRKVTAVPCLALVALGVYLIAVADGYVALLVGGLVAGFGNGLGSGINMTLAGDFSPREGRADFIGVWRLTTDLGAAIAPFAMGAIASAFVLTTAGTLAAAVGAGGALLLALGVPEPLRRDR